MGDVTPAPPFKLLIVCGLTAEARIAAGPGVETLCSGGDAAGLEKTLRTKASGFCAIMSLGIAGGLSPELRTGSIILADVVMDCGLRRPTDAGWTNALAERLPGATRGFMLGSDHAVATIEEKRRLFAKTSALGIDMESHVVARIGAELDLPVAVLRVVSDPARRALPPAALVGMRPDGTPDIAAVLGSLLRNPAQLPALIATAFEVGKAMQVLKHAVKLADGAAAGSLSSRPG